MFLIKSRWNWPLTFSIRNVHPFIQWDICMKPCQNAFNLDLWLQMGGWFCEMWGNSLEVLILAWEVTVIQIITLSKWYAFKLRNNNNSNNADNNQSNPLPCYVWNKLWCPMYDENEKATSWDWLNWLSQLCNVLTFFCSNTDNVII